MHASKKPKLNYSSSPGSTKLPPGASTNGTLNKISEMKLTKDLYQCLVNLRKKLADKEELPAYCVFNNATLTSMAESKPITIEEVSEISGVGEAKKEKYAHIFLAEICRFLGPEYVKAKMEEKKRKEEEEKKRQEDRLKQNKKEEIVLKEWTPSTITLTKDDIEALSNTGLHSLGKDKKKRKKNDKEKTQKLISISPTGKGDNSYVVIPKNVIGAIELPTKILIIQPKISIKNILFILCYSWEPLNWNAAFDLFKETGERMDSLAHAIASVFVQRVSKAFSKGIVQGYSPVDDSLQTVRGRIRWSDQIRSHYGRMPPVEVTYEEFTEDVEENRLIKAACSILLNMKHFNPKIRLGLKSIKNKLEVVKSVDYHKEQLPEIIFTPINEHYRASIELALFVLRNSAWTLDYGTYESATFLLYMPKVYEDFVVRALRESKPMQSLNANSKNFPQNKPLRFDTKGNIEIKPDYSFWDGSVCRFVGDCKYKRLVRRKPGEVLETFEDDINSLTPDLYQLLSYTIATNLNIGLLIYAEDKNVSGNENIPVQYQDLQPMHTNTLLKRRALNLNVDPQCILNQIDFIAKEIVATVQRLRSSELFKK